MRNLFIFYFLSRYFFLNYRLFNQNYYIIFLICNRYFLILLRNLFIFYFFRSYFFLYKLYYTIIDNCSCAHNIGFSRTFLAFNQIYLIIFFICIRYLLILLRNLFIFYFLRRYFFLNYRLFNQNYLIIFLICNLYISLKFIWWWVHFFFKVIFILSCVIIFFLVNFIYLLYKIYG